jgi:hypothetical protein
MAITNPPIALHNAGATHTAEMLRNAYNALISGPRTANGLVSRGGVQPFLGSAMLVTQSGSPAMNVSVASGICWVPGTEGSQQGTYACLNQSATTVAVTASHGSLPRIDLIVARVYDTAYSGVLDAWALEVVTGTAAASPVAPTAPNNSLLLAQLNIAAASTQVLNANITDRRIFVSTGYILCTSTVRPAVPVAGMVILESDTGKMLRYTSSATWVPTYEQEVTTKVTSTSSSGSVSTTEATVQTTSSATFKANRAYEIRVSGAILESSNGAFSAWKIRKTNLAGAIVLEWPRSPTNGMNLDTGMTLADRIFTVGGSDVTAPLVLTAQASGGSTVIHSAAATFPRGIMVREIGPSSAYSGECVLS